MSEKTPVQSFTATAKREFVDAQRDAVKRLEALLETTKHTLERVSAGGQLHWSDDPGHNTATLSRELEAFNRTLATALWAAYIDTGTPMPSNEFKAWLER